MPPSDFEDHEVQLADARMENFGKGMMALQEAPNAGPLQLSARLVGDLFGSITTAQPVLEKRNVPALIQTLKALAETFGEDYVYSWDVNDKNSKRPDKKTTIEGPTIQLANDLAREFGNCSLESRTVEDKTHWEIYSRFTDLQTGYALTRGFRQRKNAMAGKYEDDRKLDMAYQMGQSKSQRNVVTNALRSYAEFMLKIAKGALVQKIKDDPEKYLKAIERGLEKFNVPLRSAEAIVGRTRAEWDARDIAKVFSALKAVTEGLADAREVFPHDGPQMDDDNPVQDVEEEQNTQQNQDGVRAQSGAAAGESGAGLAAAEAEPGAGAGKLPASGEAEPAKAKAPAKDKPKAPEEPKPKAKKPAALFPED